MWKECNNKISEEMKINGEQSRKIRPNIMMEKRPCDNLDVEFSLHELKTIAGGVKQTSPGKDEIMIQNVSDYVFLIWGTAKLPFLWKYIIPVFSPANNKQNACK